MTDANREIDDTLIQALCNPARYAHDVDDVRVIETHISWILLTGLYAFKVKKPVHLPFVDFSSLRRRRVYCEEELRLNRRLAPDLYLAVVPIGGSIREPLMDVEPAIEYAVKLREFPAGARLDERLAVGRVSPDRIRALADTIATFHASLMPSKTFGNPVAITRAALGNVRQTEHALEGSTAREDLSALREWMTRRCVQLERVFSDRQRAGAIREGHGDLHLENLVYWDGRIVPFDALEFDPRLRWIDVVDEVAFLVMDLIAHDEVGLACEFLNRYLEVTGDYAGLEVFRFYLVHRALVRTKVAAIKASQGRATEESVASQAKLDLYLRCACNLIRPTSPSLLITRGLSGSGKTSVTDRLISRLPAVRCRSDVERKRLHGLAPHESSRSRLGTGLYAPDSTRQTYDRLLRHAGLGLKAGLDVVVDATFLRRAEREVFMRLAEKENAEFVILDIRAAEPVLRQRIEQRAAKGGAVSEATLEVLDHQLATQEPFAEEELPHVVPVSTDENVDYDALERRLKTSPPPQRGRALRPSERPSSPSPGRDESQPFSDSRPNPSR